MPPEEKKQIDAVLLPAIENELKAGKVRQGRHSLDKMLTAIGNVSSAMLVRVLVNMVYPSRVKRARTPDNSMDFVALMEKKFSEIGTILARNAGD